MTTPTLIRRKRLSSQEIEKTILIGIINSDKIISTIFPQLDPAFFSLEVSKIVVKWCVRYYESYRRAPSSSLEAIYQAEKSTLKESDQLLVADFLRSLSETYLQQPPNETYIIDQASEFLERQQILLSAKEAQGIIETGGRISAAKNALAKYKPRSNIRLQFDDPFQLETINKVFDYDKEPLLEIPGDLGFLIGPLQRGHLFGLMGPMKRGKTTWLIKFAFLALRQRRRVAFISLEMTGEQIMGRMYQHMGAFGKKSEEEFSTLTFPVLDCRYNQDNSCESTERTCRVPKPKGDYEEGQEYIPCSVCKNTRNWRNFVPRLYYVKERRPNLTLSKVREVSRDFQLQYGESFLRVIGYPAYSANLKDVESDLNVLEVDGFIPDVIIIDYPDILAPEDHRKDKIHQIDETWQKLKSMSQERKVLVIAPTQGSRKSFKKLLIDPTDTPWDIRKLAHVDVFAGLNQTDEDKAAMITRVSIIVHRWEEFHLRRVYVALQQLKVAQPDLDGYIKFMEIGK